MAPENLKAEEALKAASIGNISRSVSSAYTAPVAARSGTMVGPNYKDALSLMNQKQEFLGKAGSVESKQLENEQLRRTGMTPEQAAKNANESATRAEHLGKSEAELASLSTGVQQIMGLGGITIDKNGDAQHGDIPGVGTGFKLLEMHPIGRIFGEQAAQALASNKGSRLRRETQELLTNKIKEASGSAFSEAEAQRHAQSLGTAFLAGEDQFAQAIVDFGRKIDAKRAAIRAGAGSQAVEMYDKNLNREQSAQSIMHNFEPVK